MHRPFARRTAGVRETVAVVIPCYRSATTITPLVDSVLAVLDAAGKPALVMLVDDASPDEGATWRAILALRDAHGSRIRAIRLARNAGQHSALLCGMNALPDEVGFVVTMDDDGQHRPEDIPGLLDALGDDLDLVIGAYDDKRHGGLRNLGGAAVDWTLRRLFGLPSDFALTSFRAMRRFVADQAVEEAPGYSYLTAALLAGTHRRGNAPVRHEPRREGSSGYTLSRSLALSANLIFTHSRVPFIAMVAVGSASFALTVLSLLYVLWLRFSTDGVIPGWASLMLMMGIQSTMLMAGLATILLYVARSHRMLAGARTRWRIADEL